MAVNDMPVNPHSPVAKRYWRIKLSLTLFLLGLWFVVAFVTTYFARELSVVFMGWPLGFWIAAQGAPLAFLLIVLVYAAAMDRLDERHTRGTEH